jgi:hypothetical protein
MTRHYKPRLARLSIIVAILFFVGEFLYAGIFEPHTPLGKFIDQWQWMSTGAVIFAGIAEILEILCGSNNEAAK